MKDRITIVDFVTDPALLGLELSPAQEALLRSIYGEPLDAEQLELWRECTGRDSYPGAPCAEVTVVAGARAGKDSRIAAPVALYEALFGGHAERLARGEQGIVPVVAQDVRAARIAFDYMRSYLDGSPILRSQVADMSRAGEIELANGLRVVCFPCTRRSLRGWSIPCAVLDELAFWRLEGSADSDAEVQASVRRGMIAFGETRLVKISTPYMRGGVLYDDFRRHWGTDQLDVLVWRASSALMNPGIDAARLERERRLDPQRYAREYEAEFVEGLEALFDAESLERCVRSSPREFAPVAGVPYRAFVDPSGGRRDAFTLAIGHRDGARCVVDCLRAWRPPFNPSGVVREIAEEARAYQIHSVTGDRYAAEWPREQFRASGLSYEVASKVKSDLYVALLPAVNAELVEVPDDERLLRELRSLERRRGPSGRDKVDHPARGSDDLANAVAGLADAVLGGPTSSMSIVPLSRWVRPGPERLEVADGLPWWRSSRELVR